MGNDTQQFNQQNNATDRKFIEEQERKQQQRDKEARLAKLRSLGCADVTLDTLHLFDDNGKKIEIKATDETLNDPASPTNKDTFNENPSLNESKTAPSEEFNKEHHTKKQHTNSQKDKEHNQEKAKDNQKHEVLHNNTEAQLFNDVTTTKTAVVDNNNVTGQKETTVKDNAYKNKKEDKKD